MRSHTTRKSNIWLLFVIKRSLETSYVLGSEGKALLVSRGKLYRLAAILTNNY